MEFLLFLSGDPEIVTLPMASRDVAPESPATEPSLGQLQPETEATSFNQLQPDTEAEPPLSQPEPAEPAAACTCAAITPRPVAAR